MSKALELAKDYARYCLLSGGITFSHQFDELAKELRRLAQVEAEHAALLKAISDAEPVAWIYWHPSDVTFDGPDTIHKKAVSRFTDDTRLTMQRNGWEFEPLYTLNGIKK